MHDLIVQFIREYTKGRGQGMMSKVRKSESDYDTICKKMFNDLIWKISLIMIFVSCFLKKQCYKYHILTISYNNSFHKH